MEQGDSGTQADKVPVASTKNRLSKLRIVLAATVALLLIAAVFVWWQKTYAVDNAAIALQGMRKDYQDMKENQQPRSDRKDDKAAYYLLLASRAAGAKDYKGAINAFQTRREILQESMPAEDYMLLATYYCRMEDRAGAIKALQEGTQTKQISEEVKARLKGTEDLINKEGCESWVTLLDLE